MGTKNLFTEDKKSLTPPSLQKRGKWAKRGKALYLLNFRISKVGHLEKKAGQGTKKAGHFNQGGKHGKSKMGKDELQGP